MIECIFTLDYELYGDGTGSLRELVYEPATRLKTLFLSHGVRFVTFVEVAELQKIDEHGTDTGIGPVQRQVRELFDDGFEIGLHLHPQWCKARYEQDRWRLEPREYNLCTLARPRMESIVDDSLEHLRRLVGARRFTPLSFRAGNWLFQPTQPAAAVLAERGFRVDSSLFKGGLLHAHGLDYRPSLANGAYWRFSDDVNTPDPGGPLVELPIHVRMVPSWRMVTAKRMRFSNPTLNRGRRLAQRFNRARDLIRPRYPLKLDFCRMTLNELTSTMDEVRARERGPAPAVEPVVAIGHTKDLVDLQTIAAFLRYLKSNDIPVSTLTDVYPRL